jgi:hypothetical protein
MPVLYITRRVVADAWNISVAVITASVTYSFIEVTDGRISFPFVSDIFHLLSSGHRGSFPRPGRDGNRSPPSSVVVNNE